MNRAQYRAWGLWVKNLVVAYPLFLLALIAAILTGAVLLSPVTIEREVLAPVGITDRVFFGQNVVIAEEFLASNGLSGVRVRVGSHEGLVSPLILHIREERKGPDLRAVPLFFTDPDTEPIFRFNPLWGVGGKKLTWILEAPNSADKAFWAFREQDQSAYTEGQAFVNDRVMKGNFGFTVLTTKPSIVAWWTKGEMGEVAIAVVERSILALTVCTVVGLLLFARRLKGISEHSWVVLCIGLSIIFHIVLALSLPVIHDEAAYIQDVLQIDQGIWPFRDILTKGPFFLALLYGWQFIIPNVLIGWRLLSILASVLTIWFGWKLAKAWQFSTRERYIVVGLLALVPAGVALTTPLLLQVIATPLVLAAMWMGWQGVVLRRSWYVIVAALGMVLAYGTRVSSAVGALALGVLILLFSQRRWRDLSLYVVSGLFLFGCILALGFLFLDWEKAAVTFNFEALVISQQRGASTQEVADREPIIRSLVEESRLLWQGGVILIVPLIAWPLFFISRNHWWRSLVIFFGTMYVLVQVYLNLSDMGFLTPLASAFFPLVVTSLVFGVPLVIALVHFLYVGSWWPSRRWLHFSLWLMGWLALLAFAYGQWGRFRQSYLTEFIPPLAFLAALIYSRLGQLWHNIRMQPVWFSWLFKIVFIFLLTFSLLQGAYVMVVRPFTGTIDRVSLHEISQMVREHVPRDAPIFTAQPIITAFADRRIMFGYSHPGWYRESRLGVISPELLRVFFKDPEEITAYLQNEATFVLLDHRTDEIYFDGYEDRKALLVEHFEVIDVASNAQEGEEIQLYKRKE